MGFFVFGTSSSIVSASRQSNHVEMERIYISNGSSVSPAEEATADTMFIGEEEEEGEKKTKIVPLMFYAPQFKMVVLRGKDFFFSKIFLWS